ncbi:hypothetical protein AMATHDRAFT_66589 [Amanita thiersii Skay4041]|uniref:Uncharacterized protein n=1 Tax=Amanita thiersii Skay4041 TaxID=703135 RepID=A0A2A9NJL5_9AGAR|nr:hypothetical protein AMATHDRAFT_66589 [Amanita thiersii Skay4041]
MSSNPIVRLAPNSVYIATNLLLVGYHWALYVTDSNGISTQHQWAEDVVGESYQVNVVDPVTTYPADNVILAYLKVGGCTPPDDIDVMKRICASVFPGGTKPTVKENREAAMTCRTWLLQVLQVLQTEGYLVRENGTAGIEETVKKISQSQEECVANGTFNISLVDEI